MTSNLDLAACDKLLTTTRSVRLRFDLERPVEDAVHRSRVASTIANEHAAMAFRGGDGRGKTCGLGRDLQTLVRDLLGGIDRRRTGSFRKPRSRDVANDRIRELPYCQHATRSGTRFVLQQWRFSRPTIV